MCQLTVDNPMTDEARAQGLELLRKAHVECAKRENLSTQAVAMSALGSGDLTKALAAGLMMLGGLHAPIAQTMALLSLPRDNGRLPSKCWQATVPGWGSSFVKGEHDPLWDDVRVWLNEHAEWVMKRVNEITDCLHNDRGKTIYPNAACYTAAVALALDWDDAQAMAFVIESRMPVWIRIFNLNRRVI